MDTDTQFETVFVPGATGPLPRDPVTGRGSTVNVPPITVRGRSYSRSVVAAHTGLDLSTISKYFSGTRRPTVKNALKLAAFFGITVDELLTKVLPRKELRVVRKPRT
jgi:Helix-turn-helix